MFAERANMLEDWGRKVSDINREVQGFKFLVSMQGELFTLKLVDDKNNDEAELTPARPIEEFDAWLDGFYTAQMSVYHGF